MIKTQYGPIEPAKPELEPRSLLVVPHNREPLTTSQFGPNTYQNNLQEMQESFSCQPHYPQMSFSPATTSESISAAAYDFEKIAKPEILDPMWLQLGPIRKISNGVFLNLPRDEQRELVTDEATLKSYLDRVEPIQVGKGNIYLTDSGLAFVEYNSFETGVQESRVFTEGGLAKGLEHTAEKPRNLEGISNPNNYKLGVNVRGFDPAEGMRVVCLDSHRLQGGDRLDVYGNDWDDSDRGYAFGVLNRSAEGASQNSR